MCGAVMTIDEKQKLYNEAIAFYQLAECGRQHIAEQKHVESHIPYIVNMCFCTELFLKMLLLEQGKTISFLKNTKHNLLKLYGALSDECKGEIYACYLKQNRIMIYNIEEELEKSKNAFVQWRYLVLDKVGESPTKRKRLNFQDWLKAKETTNKSINDCDSEPKSPKSLQFSPFFFKELNEFLIEICKP